LKPAPIVHVEISTADRDAAAAFYEELLGWELTDYPAQNYSGFDTGRISGALNTMEDAIGGHNQVIVYVESEDISADLLKAERLGGEILVPRTAIPGVGWLGIFADPSGNTVGLMQITA
jgi:uncharacterized protein